MEERAVESNKEANGIKNRKFHQLEIAMVGRGL